MQSRKALKVLAEVAESQWGMVTSAQARMRGISHMNLTRLTESGDLIRLNHGIYRAAAAPSVEHEELRSAWLSVNPTLLAYERLSAQPADAVVSGESASKLYNIGGLRAMKCEFTTPTRRQTQRADLRFRTRELPTEDVTLWEGLPVTTRERTIADLVEDRQDLSVVSDVLRDVSRQSRLNLQRLTGLLDRLAERSGHQKGDGAGLLNELRRLAGIDTANLAHQIATATGDGARIGAIESPETTAILLQLVEQLNEISDSDRAC